VGRDLRQQVIDDPTIPEPVRRALENGADLQEIRLDGHGRWWHAGARIEHERLSALFSRSVDVTDGGTAVLKIWRFTYPIILDDTPYFVAHIQIDEERAEVTARLNDDTVEALNLETLRLRDDDRLVVAVKGGRLDALFLREPHHSLLARLEETDGGYALAIGPLKIEL
jgi:hypothetical protein